MIRSTIVKKFEYPCESYMRRSFLPRLVNDPFCDPGLYIPFLFEKRAILFDLGDVKALSSKDLLKITHVFVTHAHMDHFIGFDTLVRVFLGREKEIHLFGPEGFIRHVEGKLSGYTWNLVGEYQSDLKLRVTEAHQDSTWTRIYSCRDGFRSGGPEREGAFTGILHEDPSFLVRGVLLDHRIPCMGLSLVENFYINIIKEGLWKLDLAVGPWISRFKKALHAGEGPDEDFLVTWEKRGTVVKEKRFKLGELAKQIARISPGQKITYITDVIGSPENTDKVTDLARDSDHLFIEAAFMDGDRAAAEKKYHLTARQAGEIARKAGVKQFTLFHFSPRYTHRRPELEREARDAFLAV